MPKGTCVVEGCEKLRGYVELCPMHYQRWKAHSSYDKQPSKAPIFCDCGKTVLARGMCGTCYGRDYKSRNKERVTAGVRQNYLDNRGERLEYARQYRADHPGLSAKWYQANKDAQRERRRELDKDPVRMARRAVMGKAWRLRNAEKWAQKNRANARRRRKIDGIRVDYVAILAEYGFVCHICSGVIESRDDLHMDHIIPLSKGGPHSAENIRPAHAFCNMSKGANIA